jgi:asparagine synthase (glutamine-hydrolysing)
MCGIAGVWGEQDEERVRGMVDVQRHRGPDGQGHFASAGAGVLGHARLAILDPANGRQPVHSEDGKSTLVANGMVYNHVALRRRLEGEHKFASGSDSETILHVFEERGAATPRSLDGMFAFAIASEGRLVLARDPIGIKPLYWARLDENGDGTIQFASELKALSHLGSRVQEFPPGAIYDQSVGLSRYYTVPDRPPVELDPETHARRLRDAVETAVRKRLLSDVPLGAFLSGGLDSSIIAAVARKRVLRLRTFSVGVEGSPDLESARIVARHIGSDHHEYVYTADEVAEALPEILYHLESFDEDLVRSAIPTWFCARLAARHVKVILTGEGADELFAGYGYHKDIADEGSLHRELRDSVTRLHNLNLQRVDRMTMRHGVEARVPFLDTDLVSLAQSIPPALKIERRSGARAVEKWILRKAFEDLLPDEIVGRQKEQFDGGTGTLEIIAAVVDRLAGPLDVATYAARHPDQGLRSREECLYHNVLVEQLDRPEAVLANVGRWRR